MCWVEGGKYYRKLEVWQKAMDLVLQCYRLTDNYPKHESYGLSNQTQRAAVSIPANIAEGHERQHTKEFLQFLSIAKGSLAELETCVILAQRLKYISNQQVQALLEKTGEVGRMISGLQRSLNQKLNG